MSHSPAISVIIPVYNVESWLRRAVGSLQNQTCTSYEILLVDDGSTDGSGALCDKLADDDVRIRVIHQENQGAAAARNAAIEIARGDYLYFMDGDDWCDRTMLKDMYRVASERNLDLLITGFTIDTYYDDEGKYYRELRNAPDRIFESQEEFRANAWPAFRCPTSVCAVEQAVSSQLHQGKGHPIPWHVLGRPAVQPRRYARG